MRCWIGKEVERNRNYGNLTLFVEAEQVNLLELRTVINEIIKNYNFKSIYLGANELDVKAIIGSNDDWDFISSCFNLMIETSSDNLKLIVDNYQGYFYNIIIRHSVDIKDFQIISFKLRTDACVLISNSSVNASTTRLDTLSGGLFCDVDRVVYNDGKFIGEES